MFWNSVSVLALGLLFIVGIIIHKKRIMVTAHRGASGLAPENTIAAMKEALAIGANYAELDVQETRDDCIVLFHDDDLDRTTNGQGFIWEKKFTELTELDAGNWKGGEFNGEKIPLLSEVIDLVRGTMKLNIELKISGHQRELEERVVQIITQKNFIDQCILTSFHLPSIEKVKSLNPQIRTGLVFEKLPDFDFLNGNWEVLSVFFRLVDSVFVKRAHLAGKEIHVWTVDDPEKMRELIRLDVDSIITNRPDVLNEVINDQKNFKWIREKIL